TTSVDGEPSRPAATADRDERRGHIYTITRVVARAGGTVLDGRAGEDECHRPWNITSPPAGKAKPRGEPLPGLTGRAKWAVNEAQWGACQRTVRGAVRRGRRAYLETPRDPVHLSRASMSAASRPPRPRALFVAALLLLTLALAGAIALQAYRNFLGHKATAERVLRDY